MAYLLEPEVAGGWGQNTIADTTTHPPVVQDLEYNFDGWSGDDLLTSFPCYIVTTKLANAIETAALTGYRFAPVTISKSETFNELYPGKSLPEFKWIQIDGLPDKNDFAINTQNRLVISEAAYKVLQNFRLENCEIEKY